MPHGPRTDVVTAFVTRGDELLVLRRSERVRTYCGRWAAVSGYLEAADPEAQARAELAEELGLGAADVALLARGEPLEIDDGGELRWRVHPFRFGLAAGAVPRLDWEHAESRWVAPAQLEELETVPGLAAAWRAVSRGGT